MGPSPLSMMTCPSSSWPPSDAIYSKVLSNIEEVRARKGRVIAVVTEGNVDIEKTVDHVIRIPQADPVVLPVLATVPLQLLAYHMAMIRGCNVDQPRNLAKSVTVE